MKNLTFLLLTILLTSCITQQKCNEKFPPSISEGDILFVSDSSYVTTFTVSVPGERVEIHDTIPCPELEYYKEVKKNHTSVRVNISKGKLDVQANCDSLQRAFNAQERIIKKYSEHSESSVKEVKYSHQPTKWDRFCYWWFGITAGVGIISFAFKYLIKFRDLK